MMTTPKKPKSSESKIENATPDKICFTYIKSSQFRTAPVDGVHGGLTPHGRIQMAIYSERKPIPQQTVHPIIDYELGPELGDERITKEGFVRELEINLLMDPSRARSIAQWLLDKVDEWEKIQKRISKSSPQSTVKKARKTKKKAGMGNRKK